MKVCTHYRYVTETVGNESSRTLSRRRWWLCDLTLCWKGIQTNISS